MIVLAAAAAASFAAAGPIAYAADWWSGEDVGAVEVESGYSLWPAIAISVVIAASAVAIAAIDGGVVGRGTMPARVLQTIELVFDRMISLATAPIIAIVGLVSSAGERAIRLIPGGS